MDIARYVVIFNYFSSGKALWFYFFKYGKEELKQIFNNFNICQHWVYYIILCAQQLP